MLSDWVFSIRLPGWLAALIIVLMAACVIGMGLVWYAYRLEGRSWRRD